MGKQDLPTPLLFLNHEFSCASTYAQKHKTVSYLNRSHVQMALFMPLQRQSAGGILLASCGLSPKTSKLPLLIPRCPSCHKPFCRKPSDAERAPLPRSAPLGASRRLPCAQQHRPALIKRCGTAGRECLGHHSLPWPQRREKAEASQC